MSDHTPNLSCALGAICLAIAACGGAPATPGEPDEPARTEAKTSPPAKSEPAKPAPKLASVRDDVPLPLKDFLGQPVADVQARLGEHTGKGMARQTCVRFVPERTFFRCEYALQRYADKTGNFTAIQVGYEDGVATSIAYDGWKHASGPFDPQALLAAVGLALPEPGEQSSPDSKVKLWRWFNHQARLVIAAKQYRVELSTVDDDWARSRVEIILNDALTPEQKARVVPPANHAVGEPAK